MHVVAALVLVIRVYDVYGVTPRDLRTAASIVYDTLAPAGVEARVINCPARTVDPECAAPVWPTTLLLRIVAVADRRSGGRALGQALVDRSLATGTLATVHATRTAALAREARIDFGTLLGRTMAHEIGHLLLGTADHNPRGLMRAGWSATELRRGVGSDWRFTTVDVGAIRTRIADRFSSPATRAQ